MDDVPGRISIGYRTKFIELETDEHGQLRDGIDSEK